MVKGNLSCPCCGEKINYGMKFILESLERAMGQEIHVNSGRRCPKHNKEVGGSPTSSHIKGYAADVHVENSQARYGILKYLYNINIKRIGIYRTFIHFDIDPDKVQYVIWYV